MPSNTKATLLAIAITGVILEYAGSTAPAGFLLCYGQAVDRTVYASLFGIIGTAYGVGDGTTTFNVPDLRGRVCAGKDDMGGTAANRLQVATTASTTNTSTAITVASASNIAVNMTATGAGIPSGTTVSSISGTTVTLSAAATATASGVAVRFSRVGDAQSLGSGGGNQIHTNLTAEMAAHAHGTSASGSSGNIPYGIGGGAFTRNTQTGTGGGAEGGHLTESLGGSAPHNNVQPTIVINKIIAI
jgi:microcystin-dependent protein